MLRRSLAAALISVSAAAGAAPCNVTDRAILGSWEGAGKGAAFEQMAFAVTQGSKVLVQEQGQWQTAAAQQPAAPDPLIQGLGIQLHSGYASARARLLRAAWTPDATWGEPRASGRPAFEPFPEVVCGAGHDASCSARFEKAGQAILLILDPRTGTLQVTSIDRD